MCVILNFDFKCVAVVLKCIHYNLHLIIKCECTIRIPAVFSIFHYEKEILTNQLESRVHINFSQKNAIENLFRNIKLKHHLIMRRLWLGNISKVTQKYIKLMSFNMGLTVLYDCIHNNIKEITIVITNITISTTISAAAKLIVSNRFGVREHSCLVSY